jgi:hypothetical protein
VFAADLRCYRLRPAEHRAQLVFLGIIWLANVGRSLGICRVLLHRREADLDTERSGKPAVDGQQTVTVIDRETRLRLGGNAKVVQRSGRILHLQPDMEGEVAIQKCAMERAVAQHPAARAIRNCLLGGLCNKRRRCQQETGEHSRQW